jgi:hypothetical protein
MTTPEPERFDMNALIRAATGRAQPAELELSTTDEASSNDEPELTMNRRASGRSHEQSDEQPNETTKPTASQMFSDKIRSDLRSRRGLSVSEQSDNEPKRPVDHGKVFHLIMVYGSLFLVNKGKGRGVTPDPASFGKLGLGFSPSTDFPSWKFRRYQSRAFMWLRLCLRSRFRNHAAPLLEVLGYLFRNLFRNLSAISSASTGTFAVTWGVGCGSGCCIRYV